MARRTSSYDDNNSGNRNNKGGIGRVIKWLFIAGIWCAIVLGAILLWFAKDLPEVASRATFQRKPSITVLAADGTVVARYGDYFQGHVRVDDLPKHVPQAVMAIEDRRFYHHFGMDPIGLVRAIVTNVTHGGVVQGGSTITQQLAKNLFLTPERSLKRKIQEVLLAFWLEARFTKDEILSAYLNRVYYGSGAYGIEAAAKVYYDRPARELSLYQSAMLAGLLKAPSRYAPNRNPKIADERAHVVLNAMADSGYIEQDEADKAFKNRGKPVPKAGGSKQYYADWIVDQIESFAGSTDEDLIVETTFEPIIQNAAESAFDARMADAAARGVSQGAVVVMRADGPVLAMIGGKTYSESSFNRATQAHRQPGSSFKPFVYLAALEKGIGPERLVLDAPFTEGKYRPGNYDGEYRGPVPLYTALALSLNTATVRLADFVGIQSVISAARRAGISSELQPNISLALGTAEVSLLENTGAYATFARMGESNTPYGILEIKTRKGDVLYNREKDEPFYQGSQRFNSGTIGQLRGMLANVVNWGTGTGARIPAGPWGTPMGKTGTTQNYKDAWFMGFTDDLVAGVWMGNDNNKPMGKVTGGTFPAPLWRDVMTPSLQALYNGQLSFKPLGRKAAAAPAPQLNGDAPIDNRVDAVIENLFKEDQVPTAPEELPPQPSQTGDSEAPPTSFNE